FFDGATREVRQAVLFLRSDGSPVMEIRRVDGATVSTVAPVESVELSTRRRNPEERELRGPTLTLPDRATRELTGAEIASPPPGLRSEQRQRQGLELLRLLQYVEVDIESLGSVRFVGSDGTVAFAAADLAGGIVRVQLRHNKRGVP